MKNLKCLLLLAVISAIIFSSCNSKHECSSRPLGTSSGTSLPDSILPTLLVKFVHTGGANYLAYYYTSTLTPDKTGDLTLNAQSAKYDSVNDSYVLHNTTSSSQVSSAISVNSDLVTATTLGPFDVTLGYFYTSKGYLHYAIKGGTDSTLCPLAEIVYFNQGSTGTPASIGYVTQGDLHSPPPPAR